MSEELKSWLNSDEKTLEQRWNFAINVWKSVEITFSTKFQEILVWITENLENCNDLDLVSTTLELQCSPGLISDSVKSDFIKKVILWSGQKSSKGRLKMIEILQILLDHETYQSQFKSNAKSYFLTQSQILRIYKNYLNETKPVQTQNSVVKTFFNSVKSYIHRGSVDKIRNEFTLSCFQEVAELFILSGDYNLDYFDEILDIQKLLYSDYDVSIFSETFEDFPTHVQFVFIECCILNFRGDQVFLKKILDFMDKKAERKVSIIGLSFILEKFDKFDINLNVQYDENTTVVQYLSEKICQLFNTHYKQYFEEILQLICSALSLNAIILEKHIYSFVAKVLSGQVKNDKVNVLLKLFLDTVKKLNRSEKFVKNIVKAIQLELEQQVEEDNIEPMSKKPRLEEEEKSKYLDRILDSTFKNYVVKSSADFEFSSLVVNLVTKPSIIIWKSLIFCFHDIFESLNKNISRKNIFLLDFVTKLWCEYFEGTKIIEQFDRFKNEIQDNEVLSEKMLMNFGQLILKSEYNNSIMEMFQKCCYYYGSFQLLRFYYKPDSIENLSFDLHTFLSEEEWDLLKQRILNFGKEGSKEIHNKICIQKVICKTLNHNKLHFKKNINFADFSNIDQIKSMFLYSGNEWIFAHLTEAEQNIICEEIVADQNIELMLNLVEIRDIFEKIVLLQYKEIAKCFSTSNTSVLNKVNMSEETKFESYLESTSESKTLEFSIERLEKILNNMENLPIAFCKENIKSNALLHHFALYIDLRKSILADKVFSLFLENFQFGTKIALHKYIKIDTLLSYISPTKYPIFFKILLNNLKLDSEIEIKFMKNLQKTIKKRVERDDDFYSILNITMNFLSSPLASKNIKHFQNDFQRIFWENIEKEFNSSTEKKSDEYRSFVEKSLPSFCNYLTSYLNKLDKSSDMDENMRKICKIYIGHSAFLNNDYAIKLINTALNNRIILHFDPDEIEFVLQNCWKQITQKLKANENSDFEKIAKLVITNKSSEDFLKMLKSFERTVVQEDDVPYICKILQIIANCNLSNIKGAILNEEFKQICSKIFLSFTSLSKNFVEILALIECQICICKNSKVSITSDTMDDILIFLTTLNVNELLELENENENYFKIHQAISDLCISIIKNRHLLIMDRVPQFMNVFTKQMESICFYKSQRQKHINLSNEELEKLKESLLKLENLMHLIATHAIEFKRVAPYILTFAINAMVSDKRSTTLYPKIKSHVENICYDLIKICDHRVGRFILRCSNEASRQVYEVLTKDFNKYHKFKGKI